jgi:protein-S-isoprenylcysteine O-methyltransferase Ste14
MKPKAKLFRRRVTTRALIEGQKENENKVKIEMRTNKKRITGTLLGASFLALGVLTILYPEPLGYHTLRDKTFSLLIGGGNILVGLAAILYYGLFKRGDDILCERD